jgi:hypothetical protein
MKVFGNDLHSLPLTSAHKAIGAGLFSDVKSSAKIVQFL